MNNCYCPITDPFGNSIVSSIVEAKLAGRQGMGGGQAATASMASAPAPLIIAQPTALVQPTNPNVEIMAACQTKNIVIDRDTTLNVTELSTKKTATTHTVGPQGASQYQQVAAQAAPDVKVHVDVTPNVVVEQPPPVQTAYEAPKEVQVNVDVPVNFERTITRAPAPPTPTCTTYSAVAVDTPRAATPITQTTALAAPQRTVINPQSTVVAYRSPAAQCAPCN